ncbi:MAG: hypothetical protein GW893_17085, partial [Armatimonadetes bacterium]|nr:hypothetical protein [Armatimonadota bacterium]
MRFIFKGVARPDGAGCEDGPHAVSPRPDRAGILQALETDGGGRQEIVNEARAWLKAWERLPDADWTPLPSMTKVNFSALLEDAETKVKALVTATADDREARRDFNQMLVDLWADCVDWYLDATAVFPEETPD